MRWLTKLPHRSTNRSHFVDTEGTGHALCSLKTPGNPDPLPPIARFDTKRDPAAHLCAYCIQVLRKFEHPAADEVCECSLCKAKAAWEIKKKQIEQAKEDKARLACRLNEPKK
jgi:hypothetical protein